MVLETPLAADSGARHCSTVLFAAITGSLSYDHYFAISIIAHSKSLYDLNEWFSFRRLARNVAAA